MSNFIKRNVESKILIDQAEPASSNGQLVDDENIFMATNLEKKKQKSERFVKWSLMMTVTMLVIPVLAILSYLVFQAWPSLTWDFVTTNPTDGLRAGGIWAPMIGTFLLVLVSLAMAAPVGVMAGIYLNEFAKDNWLTRIVNLAVVNLAGVPSIVHGLFGVGVFVYFAHLGKSMIAASATLAIMTLPVIIASTKEALASVPMSFRKACWNLGASRWQTIRTIVLPNSTSGILTGVILQVSRAAGETAPILFTGAAATLVLKNEGWEFYLPFGLGDRFMALSNHLFVVSKSVSGIPNHMIFATAVIMIVLVLIVNSLSIGARIYLRSHKKW